ncbi:MAG: hypothetical protein DSY85_09270 [Marinomonas sp.]|nr:MAG: hypothetical protein DSY85_09270 [Marinomonas sp.]
MKKRIYISPDSPSPIELEKLIRSVSKSFPESVVNHILDSAMRIRSQVRDNAFNQTAKAISLSQVFSANGNTIVLKGCMEQPSQFKKIMDMIF